MTLYQLTGGKVAQMVKPKLDPIAKITLLVIIISNATGCASFLRNITPVLVRVMVAVFLLCLLGFLAGYWCGKLLGQDYPTVETMCLNTGLRNVSAGAVLATQYFPADVLFPVAFTPIFLQFTTSLIVKVLMNTPTAKARAAEKQEQ
jgi:predicted Na+-dependent transporter